MWHERSDQHSMASCSLPRARHCLLCMAAQPQVRIPWPLTLKRMKWRVEGCAMMAISRQGATTSSGLVASMSAWRAGDRCGRHNAGVDAPTGRKPMQHCTA